MAVFPRRRHIFFTEPFPELPGPVPLTNDQASGFYFRKEMEQVLLSPGDVEDIGQDQEVPMDWGKLDETVTKAVHRLPMLERAKIAGGWAGLRPLTPMITPSSARRPASRDSSSPSASAGTASSIPP